MRNKIKKKKTAKRILQRSAWKMAKTKIMNPGWNKTKLYKRYSAAIKIYDRVS